MRVARGAASAEEIIGREAELASIAQFLEAPEDGARLLLIEGEPGIGKTTLANAAIAAGRDSYRILSTRPAEAEAKLSFTGLSDLLDPGLGDVLPGLSEPQSRALRVALLLEDVDGRAPDRRAVATGFLAALRTLARAQPVLIVVDDVQWLDAPSASAFAFAARRLEQEPIALVVAQRAGSTGPPLGHGFRGRLQRLAVDPLSLGALHRLLHTRLALTLPRPTLRRLHAACGGNPFFALEIGHLLAKDGAPTESGGRFPIPDDLQDLLRRRLAGLPKVARDALVSAAALGDPSAALVEQFAGSAGVEKALEAGVLVPVGERLRFAHPLLAEAIQAQTSATRLRAVHAQLARLVRDPEERARHRALATANPRAAVAAALEEAAVRAHRRGAAEAAADLCEQARRLTPSGQREDAWRRSIFAAEIYLECGGLARARALLEDVIASAPRGEVRGRALQLLGCVTSRDTGWAGSLPLHERALAEVEEPALRASIEADIEIALRMSGDLAAAAARAEAALELSGRVGNPWLLRDSLVALAWSRFHLGSGFHTDLLRRAAALGSDSQPEAFQDLTYFVRSETKWGLLLALVDEVDDARAKLDSLRAFVLEQHLDDFVPHVLSFLGHVEYIAGNWERALHWAEEAEDEAVQLGQSMGRGQGLFVRAAVAANRGHEEALRAAADDVAAIYGRGGHMWARQLGALGHFELSRGNAAEAHAHLRTAAELRAAGGYREPAALRFHHDDVEALVALGGLEEAEALVEWLEERAQALGRSWGLAISARCRGLICAARGNLPAAQNSLERALEAHERLPQPFERARTLLVLGQVRRRAKQKRPAREPLEQALATFEELGAPLWGEKARAELARIGGRAASAGELTSTERRVAELVAEGRSNKEVAAALFVTTKTVESNLSRVYTKLGARSRTELARLLSGSNGASKL